MLFRTFCLSLFPVMLWNTQILESGYDLNGIILKGGIAKRKSWEIENLKKLINGGKAWRQSNTTDNSHFSIPSMLS